MTFSLASSLSPAKRVISLPPPRPHPRFTTTTFHHLFQNQAWRVRHINRTNLGTDQPKVYTGFPSYQGTATAGAEAGWRCTHPCTGRKPAVRTVISKQRPHGTARRAYPPIGG